MNSISARLDLCLKTIRRWARARREKEPKVAAGIRALLVHLNEEVHGTLEDLVATASHAVGFIPRCDLLASRVNVLLGLARSIGCMAPGVSWL